MTDDTIKTCSFSRMTFEDFKIDNMFWLTKMYTVVKIID